MIHLIVGSTGAGKTTYAKQLKSKSGGVVFSIDKWNRTLFLPDKQDGDGLDWLLERIDRGESLIMELVLQLEDSGTDAILDLGFSKEQHREKFTAFAKANDIPFKIHFLDIPVETRRARVTRRNTEKGATFEFEVSDADFDFMEGYFERPQRDELKNTAVITSLDLHS